MWCLHLHLPAHCGHLMLLRSMSGSVHSVGDSEDGVWALLPEKQDIMKAATSLSLTTATATITSGICHWVLLNVACAALNTCTQVLQCPTKAVPAGCPMLLFHSCWDPSTFCLQCQQRCCSPAHELESISVAELGMAGYGGSGGPSAEGESAFTPWLVLMQGALQRHHTLYHLVQVLLRA